MNFWKNGSVTTAVLPWASATPIQQCNWRKEPPPSVCSQRVLRCGRAQHSSPSPGAASSGADSLLAESCWSSPGTPATAERIYETCQATVIMYSTTSSAYNNKYSLIGNIISHNARRRRAAEGKNVPLLFSQSLWSHDISTYFPTTCADLELRMRWMLKRAIFIIPGEICKARGRVSYSPLTERSIGSFPLPISPWLHTTKHPFWH